MSITIEKREYGPDSSEDETKLIKDCIYMLNENTIYWKEVPVMSVWQVEKFGEKIDELIKNLDDFYILIDLTESKPPNAPVREALRKVFSPLKDRVISASAFTEKNFFINVAAKFVLGGSGLTFSVHKKKEDALEALSKYD